MSKTSAHSLSLASLFSLTTAVAVLVWVVMYAPYLLCFVVLSAVPAILRLQKWAALAERVQQPLTLTEMLLGYLGASFVSLLAFGALGAAVSQAFYMAVYRPIDSDISAIFFVLMFVAAFVAPALAVYFVVGEFWLFPERFVTVFRRLPTFREQAFQLAKAVSVGLWVLGMSPIIAIWLTGLLPPDSLTGESQRFFAIAALGLGQILAVIAAERTATLGFQYGAIRAIAAVTFCLLYAGGGVLFAAHPTDRSFYVVFGTIMALFIAAPGLPWPPIPQWTAPLDILPLEPAPPVEPSRPDVSP